jgi:hypothetical protein
MASFSASTTPPITRDPTPGSHFSEANSQTWSSFKDKLIAVLEIPLELTDHKDPNLGYAWQKYKACLAAVKTCNTLWDSGKLKGVFDKKPTQADIVGVFKGKTQWHLTYSKAFPRVSNFPQMVSWLEDQSDKLSDLELWGVAKSGYTFSDLMEWLKNGGEGIGGPESDGESREVVKGKGKGQGKGKDKDKGNGKGKGKGKGKEGEMEGEGEREKGKGKEKKSGRKEGVERKGKEKDRVKEGASGKKNKKKSGM